MPAIEAHERALVDHAMRAAVRRSTGLTLLGRAQDRGGVFAFALDAAHAHDLATLLDRAGIAVRAGPPLRRAAACALRAGDGTSRASFGLYTTPEEIDLLAAGADARRGSSSR